ASTWLRPRVQACLHLALLAAAFVVLPIHLPEKLVEPLAGASDPVLGLILLLTVAVGLPFVVVAASAPLLQKWFAGSGHPAGRDPYFLYAASNLGSMIGLLAFPFLLEPNLSLAVQRDGWAVGFGGLLLLTAGCAVVAWRSSAAAEAPAAEEAGERPT